MVQSVYKKTLSLSSTIIGVYATPSVGTICLFHSFGVKILKSNIPFEIFISNIITLNRKEVKIHKSKVIDSHIKKRLFRTFVSHLEYIPNRLHLFTTNKWLRYPSCTKSSFYIPNFKIISVFFR